MSTNDYINLTILIDQYFYLIYYEIQFLYNNICFTNNVYINSSGSDILFDNRHSINVGKHLDSLLKLIINNYTYLMIHLININGLIIFLMILLNY